MKKKKLKIILVMIVVVLLIAFVGISYFIGMQVFENSTQLVTNEETTGVKDSFWEKFQMDYDKFIEKYRVEKIRVESSFDGHIIPGDYIYAQNVEGKDHDTVILVHGLGGNRYSNYPLAEYFLEKGYNVLTYDQRSSGENTAKYTTFGYWEKYDVRDMTDYVVKNAPEKKIGLWGTSFGGASIGLAMTDGELDGKVDFAVLDCPVSSMEDMIVAQMKDMEIGIPVEYMAACGNIVNRQKLGFSYEDADVPAAIKDTKVPVLVINSKADTLTPYYMGKDIYEAMGQKTKQIWSVKDSDHADVWLDYNKEYREHMDAFIAENKR